MRILHIDDSRADHLLVKATLAQGPGADCAIQHVTEIAEARRVLHAAPVDLILLDLHMGPHRGLESLQALTATGFELPVVVITGDDAPSLGVRAIEIGAEDFVCKDQLHPIRLWNTLSHALTRWRMRTPMGALGSRQGDSAADTELQPGTQLGRYVVEGLLGRGGMAVVYRVRHRTLKSLHALKIVGTSPAADHHRLLTEGRTQASLHHPNLVRVTDVLGLPRGVGLIMEYVSGPTLAQWIASGGPARADWLELFRGMVRGVRHVHLAHCVHRDLKPSNVLLQVTADLIVPKIADFGIVKADASNGSIEPHTTRAGVGMGTLGYMSPEQMCDASTVDQRADLFSLGCVLFELATGTPAFRGSNRMALMHAVLTGAYPNPQELNPDLPMAFVGILDRLLAPRPERRFPDCQALLEALDGLDALPAPAAQPESAAAATIEYEITATSASS